MTTKHTPGPWVYDGSEAGYIIFNPNIGTIAHTSVDMANQNANALLITATPELLHDLKIVTAQLRQIGAVIDEENPELSQDMLDALDDIEVNILEAEQTIAKAEGKVTP